MMMTTQESTWDGHASLVDELVKQMDKPPACIIAAVIVIIILQKHHVISVHNQSSQHDHQKLCYPPFDDQVGGGGLALGVARGLDLASWHKTR